MQSTFGPLLTLRDACRINEAKQSSGTTRVFRSTPLYISKQTYHTLRGLPRVLDSQSLRAIASSESDSQSRETQSAVIRPSISHGLPALCSYWVEKSSAGNNKTGEERLSGPDTDPYRTVLSAPALAFKAVAFHQAISRDRSVNIEISPPDF